MEIVILDRPDLIATLIADAIESVVSGGDRPVLGLATGSSPLGVYAELIARHRRDLSFSNATVFTLDEYLGLQPGHPQSYRAVIEREFTDHIDISPTAVHSPDASGRDVPAACAAYERAISDAGGVDLQLLGIGRDGHIGFNEPGSSLASRTRLKTLTAASMADNARFFEQAGDVPRHVLTQGIGTILEHRHLVLIATGQVKAAAVAAAVEGPVTASVPASALQLHPHVTVVVDREAASLLDQAEHYLEVYRAKPDWQSI